MEKPKKTKIIIGLCYLLLLSVFLLMFFSKFSVQEITSYDFIKENRIYFQKLKNSNLFLLSITFLIFTILWVFPFLGFVSPINLLAGFMFGKWLGTVIAVIGLSIGGTLLYVFGNYFLKDIVKEKFLNKYENLERKFKISEFYYLLIYRFVGGIPWQLSCILPTIFNVKIKNFFFASFIGIVPQVFLVVSIGSGLEKIIDQNLEFPNFIDLIMTKEIYLPIIGFGILIFIGFIVRKYFVSD